MLRNLNFFNRKGEQQRLASEMTSNIDDECETQKSDVHPSLLLNLPDEIWSLILEYVPQKDRIHQRRVSKQWCKTVDECSTLKINYSEVPPHLLKHVLSFRIRGCEFSGLKNKMETFVYPLLLKEITFGPCVTAENTSTILTRCFNVESLRFFVTEKSDTAFDKSINHTEYLKNLRRLQSIELGILFFGRRNSSSISSTFSTLIGNMCLVFQGLTQVIIRCTMTDVEWIEFFRFVQRHKHTLRRLHLFHQCICESNSISSVDSEIGKNAVTIHPNLNYLCEGTFTSLVLMKGANSKCSCGGQLLWSTLISSQNSIQYLCTDVVPNTSVISEFVQKNKAELRSIKLFDISLGIDATMDVSVFRDCFKLQELSLHFLSCTVIVMKVKEKGEDIGAFTKKYSECCGLQFLPKSLQKLSIKGCDILSSTLIEMSQSLTGLQELNLGDPGSPSRREYGVSLEVLISLIQNVPNLMKLQIHKNFINVSCVDNMDHHKSLNGSGWKKIKNLLHSLGLITESGNMDDLSGKLDHMDSMGKPFDTLDNNNIDIAFSSFNGKRTELIDQLNAALLIGVVSNGSENDEQETIYKNNPLN